MRRVNYIIIGLLLMTGCRIDEPDMSTEKSFTKVYGMDGISAPSDAVEMPNGDFIIVGNFHKASNSDEISGPFIIRTDANGNQIQFRNFYITRAKVPGLSEFIGDIFNLTNLDDTWNTNFGSLYWLPWFTSVTPLKNGNLFMLGEFLAVSEGIADFVAFSLIIDANLKPLKINYLNNTQMELADGFERFVGTRSPKPILMDNGDVIALLGEQWLYYFEWFPGYGICRFNESGELIKVIDIPLIDGVYLTPDSWVLKDQTHVITCGLYFDPGPWDVDVALQRDNDIYLHNINLETGIKEQDIVFGKGNFNLTWRGGIQSTGNGFVIGDYHSDTVGQDMDYNDDGYREIYGGLWFVDENLDSVGKAHTTAMEVEQQLCRIVKTTDGGFVAGYSRQRLGESDFLIVKTDPEGNVLWRRLLDVGVGDDLLGALKIIATKDGGVALLARIDYNSMGSRINLIKLSSDGSF